MILFDMMDYPQSFAETRTFWKHPCFDEAEPKEIIANSDLPQNGKTANFILKVVFRQNASWQGSLSWLNQNKEESFRSVLELLKLIDNALST